ncbi:MAG: Glyoxylase, beta-lactamase superfamily [Alphaproteobacteria bacterium]|nr:Glyoxylase, beta-lactamase superfamily [Alphaproteobacteria bacterium]
MSARPLAIGAAAIAAWLLGTGFACAETTAAPPQPVAERIAEGVWLIPGGILPKRQPDGNTILFGAGRARFVVMDTGRHAWHRAAILDFVRARHGTIIAIVNSHWHLDHVSGNPELKRAFPDARVYASRAIDSALTGFLARSVESSRQYLEPGKLPPETQEDIRNDIATIENGAKLRPDVPVDGSLSISFGRRVLRLNLARDAATAGDVWVYDAATRTAVVGDLVTLPAPFLDTACPEGWRRALAQIAASPFIALVPGHGARMDRGQFATYRAAFEALLDCAGSARSKTECAEAWTQSVTPLLGPDPGERRRSQAMTEYYVEEVLRANGGKSAYCGHGG